MKKKLFALSLITAPALFGECHSDYECCDKACSSCCYSPCESCCIPKPKKCIDCECYTPAFYDLQCDWGVFLDLEFLYWYARETNLSYGATFTAKNVTPDISANPAIAASPSTYNNFSTSWDPGVRLGMGWNSSCDGWDVYLNWTYLKNNQKNSTSVPNFGSPTTPLVLNNGEKAILNPWLNMSLVGPSQWVFDSVSAKWELRFNQIDLELGRKYWLSRCFNLRPYTGLRGAWTEITFNTTSRIGTLNSDGTSSVFVVANFQDDFTNKYWGVGFFGGIQPTWYLCSDLAIYANVNASLIWGEFESKKKENYLLISETPIANIDDYDITNTSDNSFFMMQPIIDLAIGLRWEEKWCYDRYRTTLDLGWEHHIWFDHNHRMKMYDFFNPPQSTYLGFRSYAEATGDLGFGGFVLRARFDF